MKFLFTYLLLLIAAAANAAIFYISNSGSASNNGTSAAAPWSFSKLQNEIARTSAFTINPGDAILFKRGEVFYGAITIGRPGTAAAKIKLAAYGAGAKPVISGFTTVSDWVSLGGNIYESANRVSALGSCWMVVVNNKTRPMARFPNLSTSANDNYGFLKADSTSIKDNEHIDLLTDLPLSPSMEGALIVAKSERFTIDTGRVIGHIGLTKTSGGPVVYSGIYVDPKYNMAGKQEKGWGFFFEDRADFIDVAYEWFYNRTTGKFRIMLPTAPANHVVKVASVKDLLFMPGRPYYIIEDIVFEGASQDGVVIRNNTTTAISFNRCEWRYIGNKGIQAEGSNATNITIDSCAFYDCNNYGIDYSGAGTGWSITHTLIKRIGLDMGMHAVDGQLATGVRMGNGVHYFAYNTIDSTGAISLRWHGAGTIVEKNVFKNFCMTSDDNGAIYSSNTTLKSGAEIRYNVIIGSRAGQPYAGTNTEQFQAYGIYLDDATMGDSAGLNPVKVHHNIVMYAPWGGIYSHNNYSVSVTDNIGFFNERLQYQIVNDRRVVGTNARVKGSVMDDTTGMMTVKRNIFVAKKSNEFAARYQSLHADTGYLDPLRRLDEPQPAKTGAQYSSNLYNNIDSNYYMRPSVNESKIVYAATNIYRSGDPSLPRNELYFTTPQWTAYAGHDAHTKGSPVVFPATVNVDTAVRLIYNYTDRNSIITLTRSWKAHDGTVYYPGNITLAPWTALVLLRFDAVRPNASQKPRPNSAKNRQSQ
jgi:hypothetical protein